MGRLEQPPKLLAQFAAGELEAFETLFRQFQGEVFGWIVRIVRDPAAAEDLTVETFWRIYRAHARFQPERSFGAWARRIATNVALDHLKTARRREEQFAGSLPESAPDPRTGNPAIQNPGIQNPAIRRELRERTQLAFQQLPPQLRAVAALALIEECPHAEIAEALSISTAAVKSRLFRAVRLLRKKLGNLDTSHD
ncbi:MAG: RNA polymerase sigma factor [Candidatus Sulfotelmatobacter sp.]